MITGDRLLKAVTGALIAAFVLFAAAVVIRELTRRTDPLTRIAEESCRAIAAVGTDAPPRATFLAAVPRAPEDIAGVAGCLFLDASARDATPLAASFFAHETVPGWDYLYFGPRGVLLIRDNRSFSEEAALLHACFRQKQCDYSSAPHEPLSLTVSLITSSGERPITVSFYERPFADILREAPPLLAEMIAVKKQAPTHLDLEVAFHRHYALIAAPEEKPVNALARAGRDGLFLASRGAKIRLLPWEYRTNPLRSLAAKGASYGLEKEAFRKDIAALKIFMTERFRESAGKMMPVTVSVPQGASDER